MKYLGKIIKGPNPSSLPTGTVTGSVYTACEGLKDAASRRSVLLCPCSIMPCQPYREPLGNQGMHPVYMINSLKLVFVANRACILSTDFFFFFPIRILEKLSWGEDYLRGVWEVL